MVNFVEAVTAKKCVGDKKRFTLWEVVNISSIITLTQHFIRQDIRFIFKRQFASKDLSKDGES